MVEIEWKLLVRSREPDRVLAKFRECDGIVDGYRLGAASAAVQRDVYLDTADRRLRAGGVALRVRTKGDLHRVTVKGESRADASGCVRRPEVEFDIDHDGWDEVSDRLVGALEKLGVGVSKRDENRQSARESSRGTAIDPTTHLRRRFGFDVIQARETHRVKRNVFAAPRSDGGSVATAGLLGASTSAATQDDEAALGELVLDSVEFRVADRIVHHHEIEIEAATEHAAQQLAPFVVAIREYGGAELEPFSANKLRVGFEIERLARGHGLDRWLGDNGNLLPAFYRDRFEPGERSS